MIYWEDVKPGVTFTTAARTITKAEIIEFASEYDAQPFHLDEEAAKLLEFQQAYQAAAQTIRAADTLFQSLLQVI